MTILELPWPPAVLNPNARAHWAKKDKARKKYRGDCLILARQHNRQHKPVIPEGMIKIEITFHPPRKGRTDVDNMLASIKSGLDSVAEAWGVDDSRFAFTLEMGEVVKFGAVLVKLP